MDTHDLNDIVAFEEGRLSEQQTINLFQRLIDNGAVWRLQGFYGRMAIQLIERGECMFGPVAHRGYYGQYIPSRYEVEPGDIGSPEFVQRYKALMKHDEVTQHANKESEKSNESTNN